eukprot:CAMPEP_0185760526 /NCGR_PEP_ID=MMETSP1174-20130828/19424_1 /TAXON_ID=35687 /ORGANISM="Dictyocha speculum, Strain CCMP1381" /LENGTH=140 /DNA_ID=CAMNT_0028441387 /DNA_START=237 /DNA_END=656 /DNA_ORIENTATION=-
MTSLSIDGAHQAETIFPPLSVRLLIPIVSRRFTGEEHRFLSCKSFEHTDFLSSESIEENTDCLSSKSIVLRLTWGTEVTLMFVDTRNLFKVSLFVEIPSLLCCSPTSGSGLRSLLDGESSKQIRWFLDMDERFIEGESGW